MPDNDQLNKLQRLKAMSDDDLIAMYLSGEPGYLRHEGEREMERRQLVASRELREALLAFKKSADRSANVMIWLTVVVAALTVVLAILTGLSVLRGGV